MSKKFRLLEIKDSDLPVILGQSAKKTQINQRTTLVYRTIKELQDAIEDATKNGKSDLANKLTETKDELQAWLDEALRMIDAGKFSAEPPVSSSENSGNNSNKDEAEIDDEEDSETSTKDSEDDNEEAEDYDEDTKDTEESEDEDEKKDREDDDSLDDNTETEDRKETKDGENNKDLTDRSETGKQKIDNSGQPGTQNNNITGQTSNSQNATSSEETAQPEETSSENIDGSNDDAKENTKDSDEGEEDIDSDGDEEDTDSDEDANSQSSVETIENPFKETPKHAKSVESDPSENTTDKQKAEKTKKDKLRAMKLVLSQLVGGERDGATNALKDLLNQNQSANESIQESLNINKTLLDMSDDEFNSIINDALNQIEQVRPIRYTADREARVTEIKADSTNKISKELEQEDEANIGANVITNRREIDRYKIKGLPNLNAFKIDFYRAIKDQVEKTEEESDSWAVINRRHANDSIVKPGTYVDDVYKEAIPNIQVYLDCSGSFSYEDIQKERALMNVIAEFVNKGEVSVDIFYFANHVYTTYDQAASEGGTAAWPYIVEQLKDTKPNNVLIVTDSDMDSLAYRWYASLKYQAPGCVWYIWKKSKAPNCVDKVNGRISTLQYSLN